MTQDATTEIVALLANWDRYFTHLQVPTILHADDAMQELKMGLVNLRRRLRDGPGAPLRVALFGPTGAGKSKLFSSLVDRNLSASGFKRPFTRKAVYYLHDDWRAISASLDGEVHFHQDAVWRESLLVDTPDFDSVDQSNRVEAERVFLEADAFLFVTDSLKYADASTWDYITRIRNSRKNFCVIMNKVGSQSIVDSFQERFASTFASDDFPTLIVVPELPLADDQRIPASHPSMVSLREVALALSADAGPQASARMFEQETDGVIHNAELIRQRSYEVLMQFDGLLDRNEQRLIQSRGRLYGQLSTGLGAEVREEVYNKVLRRLDKIDVLRYPRRLITAPFRGLAAMIGSWISRSSPEQGGVAVEAADPVTSETFHLLESEIIRMADESRVDITAQPGFEQLLPRDTFHALRMSHEEVKQRFAQHYEQFKEWLATHARDTASQITTEHKAKFILSQVLFNTLMITAQVHTAGALSFFELGVDSLLSPFVAKAVGMAIGNEKVAEFEQRAREQHQHSLNQVLDEAAGRFRGFLTQTSHGIDSVTEQLEQIMAHRSTLEQLIQQFRRQATHG